MIAAGLPGLLLMGPLLAPQIAAQLRAAGQPVPPTAQLVVLAVLQPLILLLVLVTLGTLVAPTLGLRSHMEAWAAGRRGTLPPLRTELPGALRWGAIGFAAMILLDLVFRPWLGAGQAALDITQPRTLTVTLVGLLYGGLTEELMIRWGLLTVLAWVLWKVAQRGRGAPQRWILWTATVLAAVAFGAGHLGAVALAVPLTPGVVARTVLVNAAGGVVFGWLFWRRSLESAMVAHASFHVLATALSWLG